MTIDNPRTTVVIPAAGRVPDGILALSNISCPVMIPVAGRPLVHWTMTYLRALGLERFVFAVQRRGMFVEDFVECAFGQSVDVRFIVPTRDAGVGNTVLELLQEVETESALVVLGDTHFQFEDPALLGSSEPFVLVHPVEDSYRWCIAEIGPNGTVTRLRDKQPHLIPPIDALIGVYYFPDVEQARKAAMAAVDEADGNGRAVELAAILDRVRESAPIRAIRAGEWLDCGNPDRQASSHRTLLQKRDFNELYVDPVLGSITKRSRHVEKLIDEINYLRLLPADLAVLFPRVLDSSTDWEDPWVTLEYYGYPTLAEAFLFEDVDPGIWERVFAHLYEIVTGPFTRRLRPLRPEALREMYVEKTRRRLAQLTNPPELARLASRVGTVVVNGRELPNIQQLWEEIESEVERLVHSAEGTVIHGDLCLSNILYDFRSRICKLVDPRGSFGTPGLFGDQRYDVAKLYHSVYGRYDFITNDLFHVSLDGNRVSLDIRVRPSHEEIRHRFERVFFDRFPRKDVLLITGLIFAGLPALHYDRPDRQLAMYARAVELLAEALRE